MLTSVCLNKLWPRFYESLTIKHLIFVKIQTKQPSVSGPVSRSGVVLIANRTNCGMCPGVSLILVPGRIVRIAVSNALGKSRKTGICWDMHCRQLICCLRHPNHSQPEENLYDMPDTKLNSYIWVRIAISNALGKSRKTGICWGMRCRQLICYLHHPNLSQPEEKFIWYARYQIKQLYMISVWLKGIADNEERFALVHCAFFRFIKYKKSCHIIGINFTKCIVRYILNIPR